MCGERGVCACSGEKSAKQKRHKKKGNSRTGGLYCWLQFSENDLVCLIGESAGSPIGQGGLVWGGLLLLLLFFFLSKQFNLG